MAKIRQRPAYELPRGRPEWLCRLACWLKGHWWRFNNGNPMCGRCGAFQYTQRLTREDVALLRKLHSPKDKDDV
jgi:hypothetical protein